MVEYYDLLEAHDWTYNFTDDHRVWKLGQATQNNIVRISNKSPEHEELYKAFSNHVFSGFPWGTEKASKPIKPE